MSTQKASGLGLLGRAAWAGCVGGLPVRWKCEGDAHFFIAGEVASLTIVREREVTTVDDSDNCECSIIASGSQGNLANLACCSANLHM